MIGEAESLFIDSHEILFFSYSLDWWRIYEILVDISAALFSFHLNFRYERDFSFSKFDVCVKFVQDVDNILNFPRAKFTRVKHEQNTIDVETRNTNVFISTTCIFKPRLYNIA